MTEDELARLEMNSIVYVTTFFELALATLPDYVEIRQYEKDFPFA